MGGDLSQGGGPLQQVFQHIESIEEQLINANVQGRKQQSLDAKSPGKTHGRVGLGPSQAGSSPQKVSVGTGLAAPGQNAQRSARKYPSNQAEPQTNLPALRSYGRRSKSIQNPQYWGAPRLGGAVGLIIVNGKCAMGAAQTNRELGRTVDADCQMRDQAEGPFGAAKRQSPLQALKGIDRDIRKALDNAKIEDDGQHGSIQSPIGDKQGAAYSLTDRFSRANFHCDPARTQRGRDTIDKYDLLNPGNSLSKQTLQQKLVGHASKVNFNLESQFKERNKPRMEGWKLPMENSRCSNILKILTKFKAELYADLPNQQYQEVVPVLSEQQNAQLVYRLNQNSERDLDSAKDDAEQALLTLPIAQPTEQIPVPVVVNVLQKLQAYLSPTQIRKKEAFKGQQWARSQSYRRPQADAGGVSFPEIRERAKFEADGQDSQNRRTLDQFAQVLSQTRRSPLIASKLMQSYLTKYNQEQENSKGRLGVKAGSQRIMFGDHKDLKVQSTTQYDREFAKFTQLLFKQDQQAGPRKQKARDDAAKARKLNNSVMTKLNEKSTVGLLDDPRQRARPAPRRTHVRAGRRDQGVSPREGGESLSSRQSATVSKGNEESRERLAQDLTPDITTLHTHLRETKGRSKQTSDDEQPGDPDTLARQAHARKSSVNVVHARGNHTKIEDEEEINSRTREGAQAHLNQTLPLLGESRKSRAHHTLQHHKIPGASSGNEGTGIDFLQKIQNQANRFGRVRQRSELLDNEDVASTAQRKTQSKGVGYQQYNQSGPNRSSMNDSINVSNAELFRSSKMSPKLYLLNQNQSSTPYKLDAKPDFDAANLVVKAQQSPRQAQKFDKANLRVKGKSKYLGSMQEWLVGQQRQLQHKEHVSRTKQKLGRMQGRDDRNEGAAFKSFENLQAPGRIGATRDAHMASGNLLPSEGTQVQSPTSLKHSPRGTHMSKADLDGSRQATERQPQSPPPYTRNEGKEFAEVWGRGSYRLQTLQDAQSANDDSSPNSPHQAAESGTGYPNQGLLAQQHNQVDQNQTSHQNLNFQSHSSNSPMPPYFPNGQSADLEVNGDAAEIQKPTTEFANATGGKTVHTQKQDGVENLPKSKRLRNQQRLQVIQQQLLDRQKMSKITLVFDGREMPSRNAQLLGLQQRLYASHDPEGRLGGVHTLAQQSSVGSGALIEAPGNDRNERTLIDGQFKNGMASQLLASSPKEPRQLFKLPSVENTDVENTAPGLIDHSIAMAASIGGTPYRPEIPAGGSAGIALPPNLKPGQIKEIELSSDGEDSPGGVGNQGSRRHIIQVIDSERNLHTLRHLKSIQQLQGNSPHLSPGHKSIISMRALHHQDDRTRNQGVNDKNIYRLQNGEQRTIYKQKLSVVNLDLNLGEECQRAGLDNVKNGPRKERLTFGNQPVEMRTKLNTDVTRLSQQNADAQSRARGKMKLKESQHESPGSKGSSKAFPSNRSLRILQAPQNHSTPNKSFSNNIKTGVENIDTQESRGNEKFRQPASPASPFTVGQGKGGGVGSAVPLNQTVKVITSHVKSLEGNQATSGNEGSVMAQSNEGEGQELQLRLQGLRQSRGLTNKQESMTVSPLKTPKGDDKSQKSSPGFRGPSKDEAEAELARQPSSVENASQALQKTGGHGINQWQIQSVQSTTGAGHQIRLDEGEGTKSPSHQLGAKREQQNAPPAVRQDPQKLEPKTEKVDLVNPVQADDQADKQEHQDSPDLPTAKRRSNNPQMARNESKRSLNQQQTNKGKKALAEKKKASQTNLKQKGDNNVMFNNQIIRDMHQEDPEGQEGATLLANGEPVKKSSKSKSKSISKSGSTTRRQSTSNKNPN